MKLKFFCQNKRNNFLNERIPPQVQIEDRILQFEYFDWQKLKEWLSKRKNSLIIYKKKKVMISHG